MYTSFLTISLHISLFVQLSKENVHNTEYLLSVVQYPASVSILLIKTSILFHFLIIFFSCSFLLPSLFLVASDLSFHLHIYLPILLYLTSAYRRK